MRPHRVAVLALDGVTPLDLAIPMQIFNARPETSYDVTLCAERPQVTTTAGFTLNAPGGLEQLLAADTVIVPGCASRERPPDAVVEVLVRARRRGLRLASICTGAFALAATGVLDGLRVTTHWQHVDELEQNYPSLTVERDVLYVDEGDVLTSAGVCCGIDLCLHIVRRDFGALVANQVARGLVAPPHRDGGQKQFVPAAVPPADGASLAATRDWALQRLDQPVTLGLLARHAGLSQRTLIRRFAEETGASPLQWLLNARIGRARELLECTQLSMERVAQACGLGTAANLRLHFRRALGVTPTAYRRAFTVGGRRGPDDDRGHWVSSAARFPGRR